MNPEEKIRSLENKAIDRIIQWAILITYAKTGKKPSKKEWIQTIESWKTFLGMEKTNSLSYYSLENLQNLEILLNKRYKGILRAHGLPFKTGILKQLIHYEQIQNFHRTI